MLFGIHRRLALGRGTCVIGRVPGVLKGNGIEKLGVFNRESLSNELLKIVQLEILMMLYIQT